MIIPLRRGTARRLGLRDAGRWLRFAELIGSSPSAAEAFQQYEQPMVDLVQRNRGQHAQTWSAIFDFARETRQP